MLEKLLSNSLKLSRERGNYIQENDMAGVVACTSQASEELFDMFSGARRQKDHPHHKIADLTNAVIDGIANITKLRSEILRKD